MTTSQQFFENIVSCSAVTYEILDTIIGDLNKNIGISANFFESASQVIGSTVTENYDLASLFGNNQSTIQSDTTDLLQQSLQNVNIGIINTSSYPIFNVSVHYNTNIYTYNSSISSTFLSGQIYSFPITGITNTSVISVPYTLFNLSGNQFNSYLTDVPIDFGIFGIDDFNGVNYNSSNLIQFDYSWSSTSVATNLLINLNYLTRPSSKYYITFYWGTNNSSFISTNYSIGAGTYYIGTQNFISQIGILTTSVISMSSFTNFSNRKNFWSDTVPYNIGFTSNYFVDQTPYLWAPDRINITLLDGTQTFYYQPLRYPIINEPTFDNYLNGEKYIYLYSNLQTIGNGNIAGVNTTIATAKAMFPFPIANAFINLYNLFSSNYKENIFINNITKQYSNEVPLASLVFKINPKKANLLYSNGYSIVNFNQIVPSAFVGVIEDPILWKYFANSLILCKTVSGNLNDITINYLGTLDNFIADFFFGVNFNNVSDYFTGNNLLISQSTLKNFTQPYGTNNTIPLNFSEYEEKSIYIATKIVSSKEFLIFSEGKLNLLNTYNLPIDTTFEIFKPISFVCDGIDPFEQGNGLALDYTLNLTFTYNNQNILNKILYLMASKYVISQNEYQAFVNSNQSVIGYYYIADPNSTNTNSYSVSSIDEFRLYGYAGLIPDLTDGVIRPILTRAFSPIDTSKYTYDEYVQYLISIGITNPDDINTAVQEYLDAGNTFYIVNLNTQSNQFVSLENVSICATNYILESTPYWNSYFPYNLPPNTATVNTQSVFNNLYAVIGGGIVSSETISPPYTIYNVPVGYNCSVQNVTVNSLGVGQIPGTYISWISPPSYLITNEQPAQIQYNILSSGLLDPSSIQILNPGSNFYFNFSVYLSDVGLIAGAGNTNANIQVNLNNIAYFTANVDSQYNLESMIETTAAPIGYNAGFTLNNKTFVGLGYTSNADVSILINDYITVDSFLIANSNQQVGSLENLGSFQNPITDFSDINYTIGTKNYVLYETELFNTISVPNSYSNYTISYITINCKLIELNNIFPSGYIVANIYTPDQNFGVTTGSGRTKVATSAQISINQINALIYSDVQIPITYTFTNNEYFNNQTVYWVSIEQFLQGCFLSINGYFAGINTSSYSISSANINNDPNSITVFGGINTTGFDLDLSNPITVYGQTGIAATTNTIIMNLRKDLNYVATNNNIALQISTTYNFQTSLIISNLVSINSISTSFTGIGFTFNLPLLPNTTINNTQFIFSDTIINNQMYLARSMTQYDVTSVGLATSSQININGSLANFNFFFNKLFTGISSQIYGGFNYTDYSQFGLAQPNTLRVNPPAINIDGYWVFSATPINTPISIYPRAALKTSATIGTSNPTYQYLGYSHNIYANIGYNSNGIYNQELITLFANPTWQVTWMSRTMADYKNFNIYNVIFQTYVNSIYYHIGLGSTSIGNNTTIKSAIFEGSFAPIGNLSVEVPVSVTIGTSAGVQVYINGSTSPFINSFGVLSSGYQTFTGLLTTSVRSNTVNFKVLYFTFSTAEVEMYWNVGLGNSVINSYSSVSVGATPTSINNGNPVDNLVFLNISKTQSEAQSVNSGFPPGDSFVIRSS